MNTRKAAIPPYRLSLRWRRALVTAAAMSGATLVLLHLLPETPPELRYGAAAPLTAVVLGCVWLLADTLTPWLSGGPIDAEERAQADSSVRRAYAVLFWGAIGTVLYLQVADARPALRPDDPHHGAVILWTVVGLVVLLPVAISAWCERGEDTRARGLGPLEIVYARFTGESAALHAGGLATLIAALPLLLFATGGEGMARSPLATASTLLGVGVVLIAAAVLARHLIAALRGNGHGRNS